MTVSKKAKNDLQWWKTSAYLDAKSISNKNLDVVLQTDTSVKGWGVILKGLKPTGGRWTEEYVSTYQCARIKSSLFRIIAPL